MKWINKIIWDSSALEHERSVYFMDSYKYLAG